MKKSRFLRPGWLIIYCFLIWGVFSLLFGSSTYPVDTTFRLSEGGTIAAWYDDLDAGRIKKMKLKRFMTTHTQQVETIQPGSYVFSGTYTPQELLDVFLSGPTQVYKHITLLEGWSSYDIDTYLAKEGLIEPGEYLKVITDEGIITTYTERYNFLTQAVKERGNLSSLEGYLYPDTYFIDPDKDIIDQLVYLQLEGFKKQIWDTYGQQLLSLSVSLQQQGYAFDLSTYGALILASIIEKEERYGPNRPTIASIFYNRIDTGMKIDADISLCYGLKTGYETCTPAVIVENLYDTTNPYNTRAVTGLPPTPIVTPTNSSVGSLIEAKKSDNFFYLHDTEGGLHTAKTNAEHITNKNTYLR